MVQGSILGTKNASRESRGPLTDHEKMSLSSPLIGRRELAGLSDGLWRSEIDVVVVEPAEKLGLLVPQIHHRHVGFAS